MDSPGKHADDGSGAITNGASGAPNFGPLHGSASEHPTSGSQQFWWIADSVPLGRQLVIAVLALGLVGIGFGIGRLGQKVIVQTVNVPIMAPRDEPLPTATTPAGESVVLDATLDQHSSGEFDTPVYAQYQPRLPWLDYTAPPDPALLAIDHMNRQVTELNVRSMENYVRRSRSAQSHLQRPASETYYVRRRTPAFERQARLGDRPARYLMPGTPLQLDHIQSRWALVRGPGGETMWIKAAVLSTEKTHRSS